MLNNKGFAVLTILYSIIVMAVIIMGILYSTIAFRNKSSKEFVDDIDSELTTPVTTSPCVIDGALSGYPNNIKTSVKCGSEYFNIIGSDDYDYYLLAKKNLSQDSNNVFQKDTDLLQVSFSNTSYWIDNIPGIYGDTFPVYVYDSNSLIYTYLEKYTAYLKNVVGVKTAYSSLLSYSQYSFLNSDSNYRVLLNNSSFWWTGFIINRANIQYIVYLTSSGGMGMGPCTRLYLIRPVVRIAKREIGTS